MALAALLFTSFPARALTEAQQDAAIASLQSTVTAQQKTLNALMAKLQYVTASGHDLTLTGNLHVVSGSGKTNGTPNGLGNVIIGYNESRGSNGTDTRTGSHNLILGSRNNYSSFGSIVAGLNNTASGSYADITGGRNSTASGAFSAVTGGYGNTASGSYATVGGGYGNAAGGSYSAIGGGYGNTATSQYAFLPLDADLTTINSKLATITSTATSQGNNITSLQTSVTNAAAITNLFGLSTDTTRSDGKTHTELTLTGINLHIVNGLGATNGEPNAPYDTNNPVTNGLGNLVIGYNVTRANDPNTNGRNIHTGSHNLILGDENNYSSCGGLVAGNVNDVSSIYATVSGGYFNIASGASSSVIGGEYNTASGFYSSVGGGEGNTASGLYSSVSGGAGNVAYGGGSSVSGGGSNMAGGGIATVSGGLFNTANFDYSLVSGGFSNTASGFSSSVSGGEYNIANGLYSSVSGGGGNTASGSHSSVSGGGFVYATTAGAWAAGSLHSP